MTFGRRKTPFGASPPPSMPQPPVDSDGKRRVFGEAIFAGKHGDMLRQVGFSLDDPSNILPSNADYDRMVQESLQAQERRRAAHAAELLRRHGHNQIRPYFLFGEGVYNSDHGYWLIGAMRLLPYDAWNVVYLPMDRPTQAATGLPFHPQHSIEAVDELVLKRVEHWHARLDDAMRKADAVLPERMDAFQAIIDQFGKYKEDMREAILDYAAETFPKVIELIADVQRKAGMH